MLSLMRAQVQYLIGELRSHKPHGMAKTQNKTKKQKTKKKKKQKKSSGPRVHQRVFSSDTKSMIHKRKKLINRTLSKFETFCSVKDTIC